MRILVLSDDFPPEVVGGAGMIAFRLCQEFTKQGHEVRVFTITQEKNSEENIIFGNIGINRVYSRYHDRWRSYVSLYNPATVGKLKKIIKEFKPDIVHAHNVHGHISYYALVIARRYVKVFVTVHDVMPFYPGTFTEFIDVDDLSCPDTFDYKIGPFMTVKKFSYRFNPLRNLFIKKALGKVNKIVAVSSELEKALYQNGIKNTTVIRNGIDVSLWTISDGEVKEFKRTYGLENADIVLFGGRLSGAKGGELILQAMRVILKKDPRAKLLVVGKYDYYAKRMKKKVDSLGIADHIIFTGWIDETEMKRVCAAAAVVVVPSVCFDSFPNGNLEAFAAGKPVVSTCFGGSREIVRSNENGYVVNPFNVDSMADAIADLLTDKEKARRFGRAGKNLVIEKYSIEKIAKEYISLFSR